MLSLLQSPPEPTWKVYKLSLSDVLGDRAFRPSAMGLVLEGHPSNPFGCLLQRSAPAGTFTFSAPGFQSRPPRVAKTQTIPGKSLGERLRGLPERNGTE